MSDYKAFINGTEIDTADGITTTTGRLSIQCEWPDVFIDLSEGPILNFRPDGISSFNPNGRHDVADFGPGEWIIRVAKASSRGRRGFYFPLTIAPMASITMPLPWIGTIGDGKPASVNAPRMREAKFNAINIWTGYSAATGALTNEAAQLAAINDYLDAGLCVIVGLSPTTNAAWVADCLPAIASLIAGIAPNKRDRVLVQLVNEPNNASTNPRYWPNYDSAAAFTYAAKFYAILRNAGFKTACPCPTTGEDFNGTLNIWKAAQQAGTLTSDVLAVNVYTYGPETFDRCLIAYKAFADSVGKPLLVKEWADLRWDEVLFVADVPKFVRSIKRDARYSAFFTGAKIAKHCPPALWAWDNATGTRSPVSDAFAAAIGGK